MAKLLISSNTAWSLFNYRAGLIRSLVDAGNEVILVAPFDEYASRLSTLGCRYISLPMDNHGKNPAQDFVLLTRFWLLFRKERPDIYLGYTVKPNIYGSIAANLLNIPVINNIAGLGSSFVKKTILTTIVKSLYGLALRRSFKVFFQNDDDLNLFVKNRLVRADRADRLPGSGVDLTHFAALKNVATSNKGHQAIGVRFLMVSRLLWDKGVSEYADAARILKQRYPEVEFLLVGFLDARNPASVSHQAIHEWTTEGSIRYLGSTDNVKSILSSVDCVVLPSYYREGVPRSLLEAAAMELPVITTNFPGCRDVVEDKINGYLVRPKDLNDLIEKMQMMIALSLDKRMQMGRAGRVKMEREFDEKIVVRKYLNAIQNLG